MSVERDRFAPFAEKMRRQGLSEIAVSSFAFYYEQLVAGATGYYPESDLDPVESLPDADTFGEDLARLGASAKSQVVVIKLNGGLGTSMGLDQAKSLLPIKGELTFLDVVARQALGAEVPLLLMNSFATRRDSLAHLSRYSGVSWGLAPDFLQNQVPKVVQSDLSPASWPANPQLEWCPPGHGDLYLALAVSGLLGELIDRGFRLAFISNVDNLGASLDVRILGYFVSRGLPFLMEVADRTPSDRKGGHLARLKGVRDGFILRESAQCLPADREAFQDIHHHRFFNTNNLWVDLVSLERHLRRTGGQLRLPLIRNEKTVDPQDRTSPPVYQLETAVGAAVSVFEGAGAVRVPRSRFAPVKTCDDLLAVRSDATALTADFTLGPNPARRHGPPVIRLDPRYYRLLDQLERRFPFGPPSLLDCHRLRVSGDVRFGARVTLTGEVDIVNRANRPVHIADDSRLTGRVELTRS